MPGRTVSRCVAVSLLLGMNAVSPGTGNAAALDSYPPVLPKMPPTRSIVVVDMAGMNEDSFRDFEAQVACLVIQGIVNRTSSQKIYLTRVSYAARWEGDTDFWTLENGLVPVPRTDARLDETKEFPALSYLLRTYGSRIRGMIRYPALTGKDGVRGPFIGDSGAFCASLTAAGQLDAIPLTPPLEQYVSSEGHDLPLKADTTGLTTRIAAHRWACENHFTLKTTKAFVGKWNLNGWGGIPPLYLAGFIDYYIASRAFVMCLDGNIPEEAAEAAKFLVPSRYPGGTPVLGDSNGEGAEISTILQAGCVFVFWPRSTNYSVYSSFPSDPSAIASPPAPVARPVDPNGIYVAFYFTEGDNMGADVAYHNESFVEKSIVKDRVPVAYTFSPFLLDVFPTYVQWRSRQTAGNHVELMLDPIDGDYPRGEVALRNYTRTLKHYLDNCNGLFESLSILGDGTDPQVVKLGQDLGVLLTKLGYQGGVHPCSMGLHNNGTCVMTNPAGSTANGATAAEMVACARVTADNTPKGEPGFTLICGGDGNGYDYLAIYDAMKRLQRDPRGRTYHFVKPTELAMQFRAWHRKAPTVPPPRAASKPAAPPAAGAALDRSAWHASASVVEYTEAHPMYAIDGDIATRYTKSGGQRPGDWYVVDMGIPREFDRVTIDLHDDHVSDYTRGYRLYVSLDGDEWGTPVASGPGIQTRRLDIRFADQNARYVKIEQTGSAGSNWTIGELNVYRPDDALVSSMLDRSGWTATASSSSPVDTPDRALDGKSDTRWGTGTGQASGQWYVLDTKSPRTIDRLVIDAGGSSADYLRGYEIYVSEDGTRWGDVVAVGEGRVVTDVSFPPRSGRYIRIVQTRSADKWWCIHELNVFGLPPARAAGLNVRRPGPGPGPESPSR